GTVCLNGAAARLGQPGDLAIVLAYAWLAEAELTSFRPRVVFVDQHNQVERIERPAVLTESTAAASG
ncbi:MAG: aspartate 1-decarboxylase, partial [Armatimonadetes bacterium]|nr:aspartate 1-decarboxylase [Armatimonadota bacterium]